MKITTFNPQIITKNAEPVVALMEELGFVKKHNPKGIGELNVTGIRMEDANGFNVDVSEVDALPSSQDIMAIRMNVDDFEEAYQLLTTKGFKNFYGDKTVGTKSSKSAIMISPSEFVINLVEHIK